MRVARAGLFALVLAGLVAAFSPPAAAESSSQLWDAFDKAADEHARVAEQVSDLQDRIAAIGVTIADNEQQLGGLRNDVRKLLVQRYVDGLTDPGFLLPDAVASLDRLAASTLIDVSLGVRADAIGQYRVAAESLAKEQSHLNDELARQRKLSDKLAGQVLQLRKRAEAALAAEVKAEEAAKERARLAAEAKARAAKLAAEKIAAEKAAAQRTTTAPTRTTTPAPATTRKPAPTPKPLPLQEGDLTDDQLAKLRACESGGNYSVRSNSRYRGAYQFDRGTWDRTAAHAGRLDLVGVDPSDADPADQDAMARQLYREAGAAPWPTCGPRMF
ncbi:MAG: transglycosylase family protein [Acidimicrobiia bacterium]